MAKKAASSKKPAAKKASASAPAKSKAEVKAKPKAEVKKPSVMAAQKPAKKEIAAKSSKKEEVAAPKAVAPKAPAKPAQPAETTEKIKIDRDKMTEDQIKWAEMYNKHREAQAPQYDMKGTFKANAPILHKVLGWGWVASNENDRLEVLFKDGKRMLISNYKG